MQIKRTECYLERIDLIVFALVFPIVFCLWIVSNIIGHLVCALISGYSYSQDV